MGIRFNKKTSQLECDVLAITEQNSNQITVMGDAPPEHIAAHILKIAQASILREHLKRLDAQLSGVAVHAGTQDIGSEQRRQVLFVHPPPDDKLKQ